MAEKEQSEPVEPTGSRDPRGAYVPPDDSRESEIAARERVVDRVDGGDINLTHYSRNLEPGIHPDLPMAAAVHGRWGMADAERREMVETCLAVARDPHSGKDQRMQAVRALATLDKINLDEEKEQRLAADALDVRPLSIDDMQSMFKYAFAKQQQMADTSSGGTHGE